MSSSRCGATGRREVGESARAVDRYAHVVPGSPVGIDPCAVSRRSHDRAGVGRGVVVEHAHALAVGEGADCDLQPVLTAAQDRGDRVGADAAEEWCRRSGWRPGSARRQGRFAPRSRQSRAKHRIAHATGGDAHDHVAAAQRRSVTFGGVRANIMRTSVQVAAMLLRQSLSLSALMSEGRDPGRPRWLGSTRRFPCHGPRRPPRRRAPIARLAATPVRRRLPDMHASPRWRILRGRRSWTGSRFQASRMDRGTSASSLESRGGTSKHRGSPYTVPAVSANRSLSVALLPSKQRRNPCAPLPTLARGRRVADRLAG